MELDTIQDFHLSGDQVDRFHNELLALEYLASGLNYLNDQVSKIEAKVRQEHPELAEGFSKVPGLEWPHRAL